MSEVLCNVEFDDVLMAWVLRDGKTIAEHRKSWQGLIDAMTTAGITGCVQVRVFPNDIPPRRRGPKAAGCRLPAAR